MSTVFTLPDTLFGRTRGALLALFYGNLGESWYLRQLARLTGIAPGPVQRELRQLVDAGLITRKTLGPNTVYSANRTSPVFSEMKSLVAKTVGMRDVLRAALQPVEARIPLAFVYAGQSELPQNEAHLLIVGKIGAVEAEYLLSAAQKTLKRTINPTVSTVREFKNKLRGNKIVLNGPKLFILGDNNTLKELSR